RKEEEKEKEREVEKEKKKEEEAKKEEKKAKKKEKSQPEETLSQQNAVAKAKDYLLFTSFSKKGLIEQLEFEGFDNKDAVYAVEKLNIDWKEQAVLKAEDY